ncbi:hypothetical protein AeRB84_013928 [Aphanomyces euteiches]|nr:hypothetical protein AeRB84_013928 [Aphanomyces euteiches]
MWCTARFQRVSTRRSWWLTTNSYKGLNVQGPKRLFIFNCALDTSSMKFLSVVAGVVASVALATPNVNLVEMPTTVVTVVGFFPSETNESLVGLFEKQTDDCLKLTSVYQETVAPSSTVESLESTVNTPRFAVASIRP